MSKISIEWTEHTWNPVTGCTKVSQGCKFCYAEELHTRKYEYWKSSGDPTVPEQFQVPFTTVLCHPDRLEIPIRRKKPTMYFVNSMSDMFHNDVPTDFIRKVFAVMNDTPQHTYQVLTKRPEQLFCRWFIDYKLNTALGWTDNIWFGVSVENRDVIERINELKRTNAKVKFLSIEPLLEDLGDLDLSGIDWVIVGGESGVTPRPMQADWVRSIRDQCIEQDVPFFFKQWGGRNKKANGRLLDGKEWNQYPKQFKHV